MKYNIVTYDRSKYKKSIFIAFIFTTYMLLSVKYGILGAYYGLVFLIIFLYVALFIELLSIEESSMHILCLMPLHFVYIIILAPILILLIQYNISNKICNSFSFTHI